MNGDDRHEQDYFWLLEALQILCIGPNIQEMDWVHLK